VSAFSKKRTRTTTGVDVSLNQLNIVESIRAVSTEVTSLIVAKTTLPRAVSQDIEAVLIQYFVHDRDNTLPRYRESL
jgi:hypothetical protein